MNDPKVPPPIPVDRHFLQQIQVGDRLFHYPAKGGPGESFEKSLPADHTLYTVIDLPTDDTIILLGAFDEKEKKKAVSPTELLSGDWWYTARK